MNAQQDTKQLSSGSETEKAREGEIYFSERMEREREGERGKGRLLCKGRDLWEMYFV